MGDNGKIYFHADDYGVTLKQAERILSCYSEGVLNSISIIANVPQLEACCHLLDEKDTKRKIRRVLHLNFVEGQPIAPVEKVSMLVDETGLFSCSFIKLLKWNYVLQGEKKRQLKEQLKLEIKSQFEKVMDDNDFSITAVDAHQHYHMIPIVMESLLEVVAEKKIDINEIRIPVDPLIPLIKTPSMWGKVPMINWIKWMILWMHSAKCKRMLKKRKIQIPVFFGIFFTCEMTEKVVQKFLSKYVSYANKRGKGLELMFHPGDLDCENDLLDRRSEELKEFYLSKNRKLEAQCLKKMKLR